MNKKAALGYSLTESAIAVGIVGLLSLTGLSAFDLGNGMALTGFQTELSGSLYQAFSLARARGTNVTVALSSPAGQDIIPLQLPRKVRWGKLPAVPLPPGMDPTVKAEKIGEAHPKITVTPRHTATATTWFLNDGKDVLCMRLSGHGRIQLLRWSASKKTWTRC